MATERRVRTSKGRETASQTVARAKAMLGSAYNPNTKAPSRARLDEISNQSFITKRNKKAYDASRPITPQSLDKVEAVNLPTPVVPVTPGLDLTMNSAGLGADSTGMFQIAPQAGDSEGVTAAKDSSNVLGQYLEQTLGIAKPVEGANERALEDARRQAGVEAAQREFNRYSSQINAITAKRDADQLSLEGQGRGITDVIIGGQQARIGREAAIQALPIQAQLAAAQGNLEQAQLLMGQLFSAKSADIQADLTYRTSLASSVMLWATSSQQAILQAKQADIAQQAQTAQANLAYQRELGLQALEYGQNGLITGISSIDPKSATFEQDIASYVSQLRKPVAAAGRQAPTTQTVDGKLYQYDYETGTWKLAIGAGGAPGALGEGSPETEALLGLKQVLDGLDGAKGFSSAVGFGLKKNALTRTLTGMGIGAAGGAAAGSVVPIAGTLLGGIGGAVVGGATGFLSGSDAVAGSARSDFETQATRLSDMFLVQNLDKMTGVLTDKDLEVLRAEGTTIGNFNQSEASWLKEKARLDAMVERGLRQNGMTVEQAVHYGFMEPEDSFMIDEVWNTNTTTPAINFNF